MPEDSKKSAKRMDELLLERQRLDQAIKQCFSKDVSILFSDICGYTQFTEKKGDLQSRAMLLKHNQVVIPAIERNHGKVIEVIGDGVMAVFSTPHDAVEAAVDVHKGLAEINEDIPADGQIHVKIGINMGKALLDECADYQSLTGDVANVAARIQNHAGKDEILVSQPVHACIVNDTKWFCRFHDHLTLKGKTKSIPIYRVIWKGHEPHWDHVRISATRRDGPEKTGSSVQSDDPVVTLEITLDRTRLNISMHEKCQNEESTLRHYETMPFAPETIDARCMTLVDTFNKANRRGQVSGRILNRLREIGQVLYDELLSLSVKERLHQTKARTLILSIDDHLVHIPWELLFDGKHFFCRRFSMGRVVRTRQTPAILTGRQLSAPLNMLVLADPTGDLKNAYTEGIQIRNFLDQNPSLINASLRTDYMSADSLKEKLRNFDLIHFAGHADYNPDDPTIGGWRLRDSSITTDDILRMAGSASMPTMVFANACQSARTERWLLDNAFEHRIFGLANAFLLAGVKHYIGTFWEILDEPGSLFAIEFYKQLFSGNSVGKAVLNSRHALIDLYGEETIIWASYVFYGDPAFNYIGQLNATPETEKQKSQLVRKTAAPGRTREEIVDFKTSSKKRPLKRWWPAAALLLLAALGLWGIPWNRANGVVAMEQKAYAHYLSGEYEKADRLCRQIQNDAPQRPTSILILGNISLSRGELEEAGRYFNLALTASPGSDKIKAEALMGLGRLASIGSRLEEAMDYYRRASALDPTNARAVTSQAVVLERQGKYEDALHAYRQASTLTPDDVSLQVAADQMDDRLMLLQDDAKQARIDRLIEDILAGAGKTPMAAEDAWTSSPLTAWLLDFQTTGYTTEEGTERLIQGLVSNRLVEDPRVQVVERAILDKLLSELKIGSSPLSSRETALTVGRLTAARILLVTRLIFMQGQVKATVRMVECETGLVLASIIEAFDHIATPQEVAERIVTGILNEVQQKYPVRASVADIRKGTAIIDVGRAVGVQPGMLLKGQDGTVTVRVSSVLPMESEAQIISGQSDIRPGVKLEEQINSEQ